MFQKNCPGNYGSPTRLTTLPQAFDFQTNGPHMFGSPTHLTYVTLPQAHFFPPEKGPLEFWRESQMDLDLDLSSL